MSLNLDRLEAFVEAAESGSFSRAARSLGKAQSSVSGAIAHLEIEVGTDLFDRSTRAPQLTPAGRRLLLEARTVLDRAHAFEAHAHALAASDALSLTLSVDVPLRLLAEPVQEFSEAFPFVNLVVQTPVDDGRVADDVLSGAADVGVALAVPDYSRGLAFRRLGNLILMHVAHRDHPLAAREGLTFTDLREHRRLVHSGHRSGQPTSEYLQNAQSWLVHDYAALVELTRAGVGWATLPRQVALAELESGEFVELRLEAYEHTDWLVGVDLVHRQAGRSSEQERWLRDRLGAHRVFEVDAGGNPTTPR